MEYLVRDLQPGQKYMLQIRSTAGDDVSEWSPGYQITAPSDNTIPKRPTGFFTNFTKKDLTMIWNPTTQNTNNTPITDLKDYVITLDDGVTQVEVYSTTNTYTYSFAENASQHNGQASGVFTLITVQARDKTNNLSTPVSSSASNPVPPNVTNITTKTVSDGIEISWTDVGGTIDDLKYYEIYRGTSSGFTPDLENGTDRIYQGGSARYTDDPPLKNTVYYYKVYIVDLFNQRSGSVQTYGQTLPATAGGIIIQDEGVNVAQRTIINFIGTSVAANDNVGQNRVDVTISGGGSPGGGVEYLEDLLDVNIPSPTNGDVLKYDAGTEKWISAVDGSEGANPYFLVEPSIATINPDTWYTIIDNTDVRMPDSGIYTMQLNINGVLYHGDFPWLSSGTVINDCDDEVRLTRVALDGTAPYIYARVFADSSDSIIRLLITSSATITVTTIEALIGISTSGSLFTGYVTSDLPAGIMQMWCGTGTPTGWLDCNGASLLRADYPDLFTAIGTQFGSVDGTHFNVPDMRAKMPVGINGSITEFDAIGKTGGSAAMVGHTHAPGTLVNSAIGQGGGEPTTTGAGAHSHTISLTGGSHSHVSIKWTSTTPKDLSGIPGGGTYLASVLYDGTSGSGDALNSNSETHNHSGSTDASENHTHQFPHNHTISGATASTGSGSSPAGQENYSPYTVVKFVIKY